MASTAARPGRSAPAVRRSASRTIEAIEFAGCTALSEETLRYYLGLELGPAARRGAAQQQHPAALGPRPGRRHRGRGLARRPTGVNAGHHGRGAAGAALDRLRGPEADLEDRHPGQALQASASGCARASRSSLGELSGVKTLIEEMYAEKGYRFAEARYTRRGRGAPTRSGSSSPSTRATGCGSATSQFEGNEVFNDMPAAAGDEEDQGERPDHPDDEEATSTTRPSSQEDLDKVRDLYRGAGYKNVGRSASRSSRCGAQEPERRERQGPEAPPVPHRPDRARASAGSSARSRIEGNEIYSDQMLLRAFEQPRRRLAALQDRSTTASRRSRDLYHNTGYIYAQVEPELVEKRRHSVADVVVHVHEGDQFKVGRIEFEGNDAHLRQGAAPRAARPGGRPGQHGRASRTACSRSTSSATSSSTRTTRSSSRPSTSRRRRWIWCSRARRRTAPSCSSAAAGASSTASSASSRSTPRTSSAAASRWASRYQTGTYRDFFDLSYYIPWFLDRPQSIGVQRLQAATWTTAVLGSAASTSSEQQGRRAHLRPQLRLFQLGQPVSYNRSDLRGPAHRGLQRGRRRRHVRARSSSHDIDNSSLRPGLRLSTAATIRFEPTRGTALERSASEYAGGFLGGDNYFIRPEVGLQLVQPVRARPAAHGVRAQRRGRLVEPFDGTRADLLLERFYLGGENSVRGFTLPLDLPAQRRTAIPVPDEFGIILGRRRASSRSTWSTISCSADRSALLVFADAGNVFGAERRPGSRFDLSTPALYGGASCGSSCPVFGAPLRFIYAVNLDAAAGATGSRTSSSASAPVSEPQGAVPMTSRDPAVSPSRRPGARPGAGAGRAARARAPAAPPAPAAIKIAVIDTERILLDSDRRQEGAGRAQEAAGDQGWPRPRPSSRRSRICSQINDGRLSLAQDKLAEMEKQLEDKVIAAAPLPGRRQPRAQQEARRPGFDADRAAGHAGDQPGRQGARLHPDLPQVRERADLRRRRRSTSPTDDHPAASTARSAAAPKGK